MSQPDYPRKTKLDLVAIAALCPTQITIGMREVAEKCRRWRDVKNKEAFLARRVIPVLLGPNRDCYLIDRHHLTRALLDEGVAEVAVMVWADLSHLPKTAFWNLLDNRGWCHPYDDRGKRIEFDQMPRRIADLRDDPFRSLSGETRRRGGFTKNATPFSEFIWADFLRRRMKRQLVERDFEGAVADALGLVRSREAACLPGWCRPDANQGPALQGG
jgi:hypothetical protein